MRIVIALGGNALLRRGDRADLAVQRRNVAIAVRAVAELAAAHEVVVTHGNGPQVGLLAERGGGEPLDVLDAETEGLIGYLLQQGLVNERPGARVATLLTQTVVAPGDPAFGRPSKPVGPMYSEDEARRLAAERGWAIAPDGAGFRRVVASPEPLALVEQATIELLVDAGVLVICAGGGGIPVAAGPGGVLHGVEAVVDKDLVAALLARSVGADLLLLLTDVPAVQLGWGGAHARPLRRTTPAHLRSLGLAAGSMGPKAEAAARFVEATGRTAAIGALDQAGAVVRGHAGTLVEPAAVPVPA